ncbi:MAG: cytochrome c [Pseudomonadota bacterium]
MLIVLKQLQSAGITVGVWAALAMYTPFAAAEFDRGQALYENHCRECHESWAHSREGRHVNSMDALRQWVTSWSVHSGLGWSVEDIDDVSDYLGRTFYNFKD